MIQRSRDGACKGRHRYLLLDERPLRADQNPLTIIVQD